MHLKKKNIIRDNLMIVHIVYLCSRTLEVLASGKSPALYVVLFKDGPYSTNLRNVFSKISYQTFAYHLFFAK